LSEYIRKRLFTYKNNTSNKLTMIRKIDLIPGSIKLLISLSYDLASLTTAFFLAYFIRLGLASTPVTWAEISLFLAMISSTLLLFYSFDVYRSVVRYFNSKAFLKILGLLVFASTLFYLLGFILDAFVPRSVPIVFFVLATIFIAGARVVASLLIEKQWFDEREGVVI
jgi:FlaA1/EpsC-like NDP-sugar epimerase